MFRKLVFRKLVFRTVMFRAVVAFSIAMSFAATFSPAQARDRWTRISTTNVNLKSGEVSVDLSKARGSFTAFRLRVARGSIRFTQIQFLYLDGTVHQVDKTFRLDRRERTKPLDERNEERFVDQVIVEFEPVKRSRRKAKLEIWGLQSRRGRVAKRPKREDVVAAAGGRYVSKSGEPGDGTPPLPTRLTGGTQVSDGDVLFGARYVGFKVNTDVIEVGRKVGKFDKIRLKVRDADIFINNVKVVYEDGEPELINVYSEVLTDGQTDWLDLKGNRFVKEIELSYRSRPDFEGRARVEVFGLYSDGWLGPQGEGRNFNDGWVLLGAQPAGFIGFDRDVIKVGKNSGGFTKIRVSVRDRAITLNQLKIIYGNGQEDIVPVRARVNAGSTFGPVDLRTSGIEIARIEARYRSRFIDRSARGKGNAIVEIWAKH